jgi:CBS domain-containing protein
MAEPVTTLGRLKAIADALRRGEASPVLTVRGFLLNWHSYRRGYWIVRMIKGDLATAGLTTVPDFESAYIDSTIVFRLREPEGPVPVGPTTVHAPQEDVAAIPVEPVSLAAAYADPTYRLSKLAAANRPPVSVRPDSSLREAVTVMLSNQFSQLPVMTTAREVRGIVSWRTIGSRLALGQAPQTAQDALEPAAEIGSDASLFVALPIIVEHDYLLVRAPDKRVIGIITTSDISLQFQQLAEPFLLLGEIENHIRRIIAASFGTGDLVAIQDPADAQRQVNTVSDLTFGEYQRLLEEPGRWAHTKLPIDRVVFIGLLDRVRDIRNDVMHFDPDGIPLEDLAVLRDFATFLGKLHALGVA